MRNRISIGIKGEKKKDGSATSEREVYRTTQQCGGVYSFLVPTKKNEKKAKSPLSSIREQSLLFATRNKDLLRFRTRFHFLVCSNDCFFVEDINFLD